MATNQHATTHTPNNDEILFIGGLAGEHIAIERLPGKKKYQLLFGPERRVLSTFLNATEAQALANVFTDTAELFNALNRTVDGLEKEAATLRLKRTELEKIITENEKRGFWARLFNA